MDLELATKNFNYCNFIDLNEITLLVERLTTNLLMMETDLCIIEWTWSEL